MTDHSTFGGYPNEATYDFDLWYSNHEPLYRAVNAYAADCLRRVPGMTDQTLGTNVKLAVRGWLADISEGRQPTNPGWGPRIVSPELQKLTRHLLDMRADIGAKHMHELSETDIGELVRAALVDEELPGLGVCQWFALCDHEATRTEAHPILGDVPICDRCYDKMTRS